MVISLHGAPFWSCCISNNCPFALLVIHINNANGLVVGENSIECLHASNQHSIIVKRSLSLMPQKVNTTPSD